jgi:uncharacterized membrane protein
MHLSPILIFHICAGTVGMLSGATSLCFRKGSRGHRRAGNVFFISMLCLSVSGAYMGFVKQQIINFLAGTLTFYLVATAWSAARRSDGETNRFDWGALLVALALLATYAKFGLEALNSPGGLKVAPLYFIFGTVVLLCTVGDVRMLARGGVFGTQRIARHLWRMCFAMFIAAGSFYPGQQRFFPESINRTHLLYAPFIFAIVMLIFWPIRVRFPNAYKRT